MRADCRGRAGGDRQTKAPPGELGSLGRYLAGRAQEHGKITRAMGDAIAFCPPLISSAREIGLIVVRFARALDDTRRWLRQ
ncbi:hypothetical protein PH586_09670 [Pseudomonas sp. SA3-5]|uniref:Uncharacterized protein n=1 Tax=Pseudomonas aestuarii TaxID=3018340 RepID=A0ABT4XEL8_9PSED|nr:hypothetical protein [Pseudomonas aestuarii]MDA7086645.1 hypothetical protein [Pseudomonas aestuarii]